MGYQATLLGTGEPRVDEQAPTERVVLDDHSWVDVTRVWLLGADTLLDELVDRIAWRQGPRLMYERVSDDPRLSRWYPKGEERPHPSFAMMTDALERRLGVPLPAV